MISQAIEILEENLTIAATRLGFAWQFFRAVVANDYDEIFARLAADHFDAAYITQDPFTVQNGDHVIQPALRHPIAAVGEGSWWAKNGLLLSYGHDPSWPVTRGSDYIDKILRGAKPSELPVEQTTKVWVVINLKTAKTLGLTVPPSLLARADEVIE